MSTIATRKTRISDLVKGEFGLNENYERLVKTLTLAGTEQIGTVFDPDTGEALLNADADDATSVWILVDDKVDEITTATAGDYDLAVLVGGPGGSGHATIVKEELKYGDTVSGPNKAHVVSLIKAQGIRVVTRAGAEG